eukprot:6073524-Pyramimonas_sp.AAC.1
MRGGAVARECAFVTELLKKNQNYAEGEPGVAGQPGDKCRCNFCGKQFSCQLTCQTKLGFDKLQSSLKRGVLTRVGESPLGNSEPCQLPLKWEVPEGVRRVQRLLLCVLRLYLALYCRA